MNAVFSQNTAALSATHAITADDKTAMAALRAIVEPLKGTLQGTAGRLPFDAILEHVPMLKDVIFETDTVGRISGWWCQPRQANSEHVILHLHGGWFN
jgi:monoterpene epsilon-lactone hydrolase